MQIELDKFDYEFGNAAREQPQGIGLFGVTCRGELSAFFVQFFALCEAIKAVRDHCEIAQGHNGKRFIGVGGEQENGENRHDKYG